MNIKKLSNPFPLAMRSTDFKVLSKAPGAAVEGLMPMQMSGLAPFVPSRYRYSA